jgi:hypothetical protein
MGGGIWCGHVVRRAYGRRMYTAVYKSRAWYNLALYPRSPAWITKFGTRLNLVAQLVTAASMRPREARSAATCPVRAPCDAARAACGAASASTLRCSPASPPATGAGPPSRGRRCHFDGQRQQ